MPLSVPYCETAAIAPQLPYSRPILGHITRSFLRLIIREIIRPNSSTLRKSELPKGDRDLHRPALIVDHGLAPEYGVPREAVDRNVLVGNRGVVLGAERIHFEEIGIPAVVVGIQSDVGMVIAVVSAAPLEIFGADERGLAVVEPKREVQIVAVVGDAHLRALRRGRTISRPDLNEFA